MFCFYCKDSFQYVYKQLTIEMNLSKHLIHTMTCKRDKQESGQVSFLYNIDCIIIRLNY